jgi:hypothetical protein
MVALLLFWLFLCSAMGMIFMAGGKIERAFAAMIVFSVCATYLLNSELGWDKAQAYVVLIDGLALIVALLLISVTNAHWPIWFAAFHAIAVATGIAQLVFPNDVPAVYTNMQGFWFFPAVTSMVIGVMLDNRANSKTV